MASGAIRRRPLHRLRTPDPAHGRRVILARGDDREEIEALAASDPFVAGGVATCEVVQFRASQTAAGFDSLL